MKKGFWVVLLVLAYFGMIVLVAKLSPEVVVPEKEKQEEVIKPVEEEQKEEQYKHSIYPLTDKEVIKDLDFSDKLSLKETCCYNQEIIVSLDNKGIKYTHYKKTVVIPFDTKNIKSIRLGDLGNGFNCGELFVLMKDGKVYRISTTEIDEDSGSIVEDFIFQKNLNELKQELICEDAESIDHYFFLMYKDKKGNFYSYSTEEVNSEVIDSFIEDFEIDDEDEDDEESDDEEDEEYKLSKQCKKLESNSVYVNQISDKYVSVTKLKSEDSGKGEAYLMDTNCSKKYLTNKDTTDDALIPSYSVLDNGFIMYFELCVGTCGNKYKKIYTESLEEIISGDLEYEFIDKTNLRVWAKGTSSVKEYDSNAKLINTIDKYNNILGITKNYILYNDNNTLVLVDRDDNKINISKVKSSKDYLEIYESEADEEDAEVVIRVIDKNVTVDTLWKECQLDPDCVRSECDSDEENCEYKSKKEFQEDNEIYIGDFSAFGYDYYYNVETKELSKEAVYIPMID